MRTMQEAWVKSTRTAYSLSGHSDCCRFLLDGSSIVLCPNPAFLSKFISEFNLSQSVEMRSLSSSGGDQEVKQCQSMLCPVRALSEYIQCTQAISSQCGNVLTTVIWAGSCQSLGFPTGLSGQYSRHTVCGLRCFCTVQCLGALD